VKAATCLLCCLLLCPVMAVASDPFNYNYVDLGYQHQSLTDSSTSKGPELALSYTLWSQLQAVAGYARLDTSAPVSNTTNDNYYVGIRGENTVGDSTDFYTDILYVDNHTSYQGVGSTNNGYRLALGLRHLLNNRVEFDGSLGHNWLDQSSNDATIGLLFNATSWLAVGLSYSHSSLTSNTSSLRLRLYF